MNPARWVRYRIFRALAVPQPPPWDDARYPRTPAGGWRYLRERVAPAEVLIYETRTRDAYRAGSRDVNPAFVFLAIWIYVVALVAVGLLIRHLMS